MSLLILPTLLLAATASSQLTTSFWMPESNVGTDKIGYVGSVIDANSSHTTLALIYDNGTDNVALHLSPGHFTMTVGPTLWEEAIIEGPTTVLDHTTESDAYLYKMRCEQPSSPADTVAEITCTESLGRSLLVELQCNTKPRLAGTSLSTRTFTYSGRGTYAAGVETIVHTYVFPSQTRNSLPSWCTDEAQVPQDGYELRLPLEKKDLGTYQVVITAGEEKLSGRPTAGPQASSTAAGEGGAQTPTGSQGAAKPLVTVAPVVVGLGAAAAVAAFVV